MLVPRAQRGQGGWPICPLHNTHPLEPTTNTHGIATWQCPWTFGCTDRAKETSRCSTIGRFLDETARGQRIGTLTTTVGHAVCAQPVNGTWGQAVTTRRSATSPPPPPRP